MHQSRQHNGGSPPELKALQSPIASPSDLVSHAKHESSPAPALHYGIEMVRAVLYLAGEPHRVIMRRGEGGRYGFLGGQPNPGETREQALIREIEEEGGITTPSNLRFFHTVETPDRMTECSRKKCAAWGFSTDGAKEHGGEVLLSARDFPHVTAWLPEKRWKKVGSPAGPEAKGLHFVRLAALGDQTVWVRREDAERSGVECSGLETRRTKILVPTPCTRFYTAETSQRPPEKLIEGRVVRVLDLTRPLHFNAIKRLHRPVAAEWLRICSQLDDTKARLHVPRFIESAKNAVED